MENSNTFFGKALNKCWCDICYTGIEKGVQYLDMRYIGYKSNKRVNICPLCLKAFSDKLSNEDLEKTKNAKINAKILQEIKKNG